MPMVNPLSAVPVPTGYLNTLAQQFLANRARALAAANADYGSGGELLAQGARDRLQATLAAQRAQQESFDQQFSTGAGLADRMLGRIFEQRGTAALQKQQQAGALERIQAETGSAQDIAAARERAADARWKMEQEQRATERGAAREERTLDRTDEANLRRELQKNQQDFERSMKGGELDYNKLQHAELGTYFTSGAMGPYTQALFDGWKAENPGGEESGFRRDLAAGRYPGQTERERRDLAAIDSVNLRYLDNMNRAVAGAVDDKSRLELTNRFLADLPSLVGKSRSPETQRLLVAGADGLQYMVGPKLRARVLPNPYTTDESGTVRLRPPAASSAAGGVPTTVEAMLSTIRGGNSQSGTTSGQNEIMTRGGAAPSLLGLDPSLLDPSAATPMPPEELLRRLQSPTTQPFANVVIPGRAFQSARTVLPPEQEAKFQQWYAGVVADLAAKGQRLNPNPDDPLHHYDYRLAYLNGFAPTWQPEHGQYRWPDAGKLPGHPVPPLP